LRCIRCGGALELDGAGAALGSPPLSALLFYTRGVEESDVFSPDPGRADYEHLRIGIHEDCLAAAGDEGAVEHGILEVTLGRPLPGEWRHTEWRLLP
jgi:hypothetical protein